MKTIQVSPADVSLMHIAAREWDDATAWLTLAVANGVTDPMIYGMRTLSVPAYDPSYAGSAPAR